MLSVRHFFPHFFVIFLCFFAIFLFLQCRQWGTLLDDYLNPYIYIFFVYFTSIKKVETWLRYGYKRPVTTNTRITNLREWASPRNGGEHCAFLNHVTMMWGAENRTVIVAIMVNRVKMIRHILSITIAANFQSLVILVFSSLLFSWSVIICLTNTTR